MLPYVDRRSSSVERDMEVIFGEPSIDIERVRCPLSPIELAEPRRQITRSLVLTASLTVAAIIVGLGVSSQRHELTDWAQAAASAPTARAASRLPTTQKPAPVPAPATSITQTPQSLSSNSPAKMIDAADPTPPQRSASTRAVSTRSEPKVLGAKADTSRTNQSCANLDGWERDDCMQADVVEADRVLRMAYARAVDDGVSGQVLNRYQRRWSRLLDRAHSDPDRVTAMLGSMARQLDDEQTGI